MKTKAHTKRPACWMGGALALAIVLPVMSPDAARGADGKSDKGETHSVKHNHAGKVAKGRERLNEKDDAEALVKLKAHQAEVDLSITNSVRNNILYHFLLQTKVDTENGVVTLTGAATTNEERELNTQLASKISGVKKVVNLMDVSSTMVTSN